MSHCKYMQCFNAYLIQPQNFQCQVEDSGSQRASNLLANLQERIVHTDQGSVVMGGALPASTTTGKHLTCVNRYRYDCGFANCSLKEYKNF